MIICVMTRMARMILRLISRTGKDGSTVSSILCDCCRRWNYDFIPR